MIEILFRENLRTARKSVPNNYRNLWDLVDTTKITKIKGAKMLWIKTADISFLY